MTSEGSTSEASSGPPSANDFDLGEDQSVVRDSNDESSKSQRLAPSAIIRLVVNSLLMITIGNRVGRPLAGTVSGLLIIFALSREARGRLNSTLGSILLILGLYIVYEGAAYLYTKSVQNGKTATRLYGAPTFGRLGGPRKYMFQLALAMSKQFSIEMTSQDAELFSALRRLDLKFTEMVFRKTYLRERKLDGVETDQAESEWPKQWDKMLSRSHDEVSLEKSISDSMVWQVFMNGLNNISPMLIPLAALGMAVSVWLFAQGLTKVNYLPSTQIGLLFGFALAALIFANLTRGFSPVEILDPQEKWKELSVQDLAASLINQQEFRQIEPHIGKRFWPTRVAFGDRYVKLIRNHYVKILAPLLLFYAAISLGILLVSAGVGTLGSRGASAGWYYHMAVAIVAIPCIIILAMYLSFAVLQTAEGLIALLTGAIILGAVPPILGLLFTGKPQGEGIIISSLVAGVAGALSTALADGTRKRVQRSNG